jgi:FkbM family methyltransferase
MNLQKIKIYDIQLKVNRDTSDFNWYQQRGVFEERVSPLYSMIANEEFSHFFDIGANYGYISLLMKKHSSNIKIIAIEADPRLVPVIKDNFELNHAHDIDVINAVVSDCCKVDSAFCINPNSSLDNRVNMPEWEQVSVPSLTLDKIISDHCNSDSKIFLKIDTQGFEQFVLKGAINSLNEMNNWMIKMEFAPNWLISQGTDPLVLLQDLCRDYQVAEAPARVPYKNTSLAGLFNHPIEAVDAEKFLNYVVHLNNYKLGWVDLVVRPKQLG